MRIRAALLVSFVALTACATQAPPTSASTPPPPITTAPPSARTTTPVAPIPPQLRDISAARADFVRETAAKYAIDPAYIESVLAKAQVRDGIIAAMSRPAEAVKPWRDYRPIFITQKRIEDGRTFIAANREALTLAESRYGVPAEIITAIIGVETSYGGNKGSYPVIDALYTLAFNYPRTGDPAKVARENQREAFFRDELGQFFALGKETGLDITTLKGSYAGAMGFGQFMPSSYRQFAVDGDGDGKRDLFTNIDDAVESVANYFVGKGGWKRGGTVMLPALRDANAPDYNAAAIEATKPVEAFGVLGYRPAGIAAADAPVQVIRFEGAGGSEYWMVFDNFRAITKYNTSRMYATAVYQLAESIAGREGAVAAATQQATAVPPYVMPVAPVTPATGATPP